MHTRQNLELIFLKNNSTYFIMFGFNLIKYTSKRKWSIFHIISQFDFPILFLKEKISNITFLTKGGT